MIENDTICAIATAMNEAGIGIIRLSGEEAVAITGRIVRLKSQKPFNECRTHTINYGHLYDGEELIDEVLVSVMKGPASYTREDIVEIGCHGGVTVMKRALETVVKAGARIADPGEFTKRAFLNGRIDLSEAEAVMDLIQSKSEYARKNSMKQLTGQLYHEIKSIRGTILHEIAFIEAALDDPEHYDFDGYNEKLSKVICTSDDRILKLIRSAENGRFMKDGIQTVILGKPNVGKSSLLNLLSGEEKAIVTDIAGTTRDVIREYINIGGVGIHLSDTAGIHKTEDTIEKIGVRKAMELAKDADLVLYLMDSHVVPDSEDHEILSEIDENKVIILLNKSDLTPLVTSEDVHNMCKTETCVISISAKENLGVDLLEEEIKRRFFCGEVGYQDEICITNIRHLKDLRDAHQSALLVMDAISQDLPQDFFSIDLMNLYQSLGRIIGEEIGEDLVNEIFSKFCTGK